jgi:ubiquitin
MAGISRSGQKALIRKHIKVEGSHLNTILAYKSKKYGSLR